VSFIGSELSEQIEYSEMSDLKEANEQSELLTLTEAADHLSTSRSRIWRAKDSGELKVLKERVNGRKVWCVALAELERWASTWLDTSELETLSSSNDSRETAEQFEKNGMNSSGVRNRNDEQSEYFGQSAVIALVDKLHLEQRRSITLELQLQQTQRLLCERNEDQHEREARALEAEAKAKEAEGLKSALEDENRLLKAEQEAKERALLMMAEDLQALKTEIAAKETQWQEARKPWYKRLFRKSS